MLCEGERTWCVRDYFSFVRESEREKKITTQFHFSFILRLAFGLTRGKEKKL
jgi:hypothetical protein